jgi:hypothetical protein
MTHLPDLTPTSPCAEGEAVRAVGWLDRDHNFAKGKTRARVLKDLKAIREGYNAVSSVLSWWPDSMGVHVCEFCTGHSDTGEIAIPAGDLLFVAPRMIVHYIEFHEYLPPSEFVAAVTACPYPDAPEYSEALAFAARPDTQGLPRVRAVANHTTASS